MITHSVYFTISEANKKNTATFLEGCRKLADTPGVKNFSAGEMIPGDRPVIQKNYDVAIAMHFDGKDELESYLIHPLHEEFLDNWVRNGFVSDIKVYDFS